MSTNISWVQECYEDFSNSCEADAYYALLAEVISNESTSVYKQRIRDIFIREGININPSNEQVEEFIEYLLDNLEQITKSFHSYYVGRNCIESVLFGDQEVQLCGLKYNALKYLVKEHYISNDKKYAYIDLSDEGIKVDLDLENEQVKNIFGV